MLNSKLLNRNYLAAALLLCTVFANAQQKSELVIPSENPIVASYIDRPGDIYAAYKDGTIIKYDIEGNQIAKGKFENPTIFDPWFGINVLVYSKNQRSYTIADRNLESSRQVAIDSAFVIEPALVCISGERNIWVLDKADMSLKRINNAEQRVEAESIIPPNVTKDREFKFIREYQNFLFIQDTDGRISVFNHIGIYLRDIKLPGAHQFNFLGEELYFVDSGKLHFFDLFDTRKREKTIDPEVVHVLLTGTRTVLVYTNKIVIQSNNP